MSGLANERLQIEDAPSGLVVVQELVNTMSPNTSRCEDLLGDVGAAQRWLASLAVTSPEFAIAAAYAPKLDEADLQELRAVRDFLRDALDGQGEVAARPPLEANVDLEMDTRGHLHVHAHGRVSSWLRGVALTQILRSQITGNWPRLKLCANPRCRVAFYDQSKNRSAVWHDVKTCGNQQNLRASRARRAARQRDEEASAR